MLAGELELVVFRVMFPLLLWHGEVLKRAASEQDYLIIVTERYRS